MFPDKTDVFHAFTFWREEGVGGGGVTLFEKVSIFASKVNFVGRLISRVTPKHLKFVEKKLYYHSFVLKASFTSDRQTFGNVFKV